MQDLVKFLLFSTVSNYLYFVLEGDAKTKMRVEQSETSFESVSTSEVKVGKTRDPINGIQHCITVKYLCKKCRRQSTALIIFIEVKISKCSQARAEQQESLPPWMTKVFRLASLKIVDHTWANASNAYNLQHVRLSHRHTYSRIHSYIYSNLLKQSHQYQLLREILLPNTNMMGSR